MGLHPGLGGKPRQPQARGTLGHGEEDISTDPCPSLPHPAYCQSVLANVPWTTYPVYGRKTEACRVQLALINTWANFLSLMTPFESRPHAWTRISGFPAASSSYSSI